VAVEAIHIGEKTIISSSLIWNNYFFIAHRRRVTRFQPEARLQKEKLGISDYWLFRYRFVN